MKATITDVQKRIKVTANKVDGIFNYDTDNAYPQRIIDIVNSSGAASACVGMKARFLIGGGFSDKYFYKQKCNRSGLTVDKLLRKTVNGFSKLPLVALHVNYNANYQKTEVNYVPFSYVRFTTSEDKEHPDMVAIYEDWQCQSGKKIDKKRIDFINFYNPDPEVIQKEVEAAGGWEYYKGQVYIWTPEHKEYPLAIFDPVLEDMQSDSKAKAFKFRNITTNFMASHIVITDKFEDEGELEAFHESLELYQGADDAMKLMHLEKTANDSSIELKKIDIQDAEDLYSYTETSVRDNIIFSFLIPPVLLMRTPGKLGTAAEIKDATAFYNGITADERLILEEIFTEIFSGFYFDINPAKDFSIIEFKAPVSAKELSSEYFPYATKNEIRESVGLPAVEDSTADVKPLYEALGVGGLQSLTSILTGTLTEEQKIAALEIVFKLPNNEASRIVKGTSI